MKTVLVSYADKKFFKSQKVLKQSALQYGIDTVYCYNNHWLKKQTSFFNKNKAILEQKRGAGYWLWKPFIILDRLQKLQEDDILVYIDSGAKIIRDFTPVIEIAIKHGIVLFSNDNHKNSTWTKRDCFYYMNCDTDIYHNGDQIAACYLALKKNKDSINLVKEWLAYCEDPRILTDQPNECGLPNFADFSDHRHDQSVLSLLAIQYNLQIFRDPSQWGNPYKSEAYRATDEFLHKPYVRIPFSNSPYSTLIDAHRKMLPLNKWDRLQYLFIKTFNLL